MDRQQILALYDREQRQDAQFPNLRREATPEGVRYIALAGFDSSFVLYSRLTEHDVEAAISAQIACFQALGHGFEWKVYDHDTPPDLKERLAARGFAIDEREAIVVLDLETAGQLLGHPIPPGIQRITDPARIADVMAVEQAVWEEPYDTLGQRLADDLARHPDLLSVYVAYAGGQPVSAAWTYYHAGSQFASLWGGSTLPAYRKQGLYTALVAARAQEAHRRDVRFLTVDAGSMSQPILEKLGFQTITYAHACRWHTTPESSEN